MIYSVDRRACRGCGLCVDACPVRAIHIQDDGYASIVSSQCTGCGSCEMACPVGAISSMDTSNIRDLKMRIERARKRLARLSDRVERLHTLSKR